MPLPVYSCPYHTKMNKSLVLEWPTFTDVYSFTVSYNRMNMKWWWSRGVERSKTKKECQTFFNLHFLNQKWSKDLEFALAKLRVLCKSLASVYNSHSHVYGLHCPIFVHQNKAEKSMQWGESSFQRAQRYLNMKYGEVSFQLNLPHCRQNHNLFMRRNERENNKNKENAVRLIVHSITHRGEIWRGGGGVKWRDSGGGQLLCINL